MRRAGIVLVVTVLAAGLLAAREASAQGFGVYEHGACTMGRAGAGVASPCDDGSAVFFNPAALAKTREKKVVSLGATFIGPKGEFLSDRTQLGTELLDKWYPVPSGYFAMPFGERTTLGIGLFAPYGLTSWWPETFEGRYMGYKSVLEAPYLQPTVAFKVNDKVYVGAGFDFVLAAIELRQRAELSTVVVGTLPNGQPLTMATLAGVPLGTDWADTKADGNANGWGAHFGVMVEPNEKFSFGARYMTQVKIETDDGDFEASQIPVSYTTRFALPGVPAGTPVNALLAPQFTGSGRLAPQSVGTEITLPDQLVFGIALKPTDRAKFFVDYQWVNWADFDQLVLEFSGGLGTVSQNENYENTHGIRVATELGVTERFVVRGGILAHRAAAPDETVTPLLPEGYRSEFAGGFGFDLTSNIRLDGAIQYIDQRDRRGRTIPELPDGTVVNNGLYTFDAFLYGFSIVWKF